MAGMKRPLARMHHTFSRVDASACADSLGARRLRRGSPDKVGLIGRIALARECGRCGLAFIAGLAFAACASTPPKNHVSPTPPSPANDCHCGDEALEKLHGFAFKGRIVAVLTELGELRVSFDEIPGAMPAGTREFKTEPEVLAAVQPGRDILARIEQRNGEWWLFDVRLLIPLPATGTE
jgi:hypothetical protein